MVVQTFDAAQSIHPSAQESTLINTRPSTRVGLFSCGEKSAVITLSRQGILNITQKNRQTKVTTNMTQLKLKAKNNNIKTINKHVCDLH